MKHSLLNAAIVAFVIFLCSCSNPSAVGEKAVEDKVIKESAGTFKVVHFKKTDATEGTPFGVHMYELKYEGEVECVDDKDGTLQVCVLSNGFVEIEYGSSSRCNNAVTVSKGTRYFLNGTVDLSKHEQGWVCENGLRINVWLSK